MFEGHVAEGVGFEVAQDGLGGFGDALAFEGQRGDVFAAVVGIGFALQQAAFLEQADLAADAGFGLAELKGDVFLLGGGVGLQRAHDFELRKANAQLLL